MLYLFICVLDKWWSRVEENGCSISITGEHILTSFSKSNLHCGLSLYSYV